MLELVGESLGGSRPEVRGGGLHPRLDVVAACLALARLAPAPELVREAGLNAVLAFVVVDQRRTAPTGLIWESGHLIGGDLWVRRRADMAPPESDIDTMSGE